MSNRDLLLWFGRIGLAASAIAAVGCKPDLGAPISFIGGARVLVVRGTPPEAKPGVAIDFDILAVNGDGTIPAPGASWAVCKEPRPPAETNSISAACLTIDDQAGPAPTFQGALTTADPNDPNSDDACAIFGPNRPKADMMARPRDPDITGGFYQPVRATMMGADGAPLVAFDLERIHCNLANAPVDVAIVFNNPMTGYQENRNPSLGAIALTPDGGERIDVPLTVPGSAPAPSAATVAPGQHIALEVAWQEDQAETYLLYDRRSVALVQRREALTVSWFATAGQFDHDVTGRAGDDPALTVGNGWKAPDQPALVRFWLVLHDDRGGVDFTELALDVVP